MIPFNVNVGGQKVGITFWSLFWFFIVTAVATLAGTIAYYYIQPYLPTAVTQATSASRTSSQQGATSLSSTLKESGA